MEVETLGTHTSVPVNGSGGFELDSQPGLESSLILHHALLDHLASNDEPSKGRSKGSKNEEVLRLSSDGWGLALCLKSGKAYYHLPLLLWPELFESVLDRRPFNIKRCDSIRSVSEDDAVRELLELASRSAPWLIDHTAIRAVYEGEVGDAPCGSEGRMRLKSMGSLSIRD